MCCEEGKQVFFPTAAVGAGASYGIVGCQECSVRRYVINVWLVRYVLALVNSGPIAGANAGLGSLRRSGRFEGLYRVGSGRRSGEAAPGWDHVSCVRDREFVCI